MRQGKLVSHEDVKRGTNLKIRSQLESKNSCLSTLLPASLHTEIASELKEDIPSSFRDFLFIGAL